MMDNLENSKCICCNSSNSEFIHKENNYKYLECKNCGFIFVSQKINQQFKKKNIAIVNSTLNFWKKWGLQRTELFQKEINNIKKIKSKGSLLDVGCGTGTFLNLVKDKYNAIGIEPDINLYNIGNKLYNIKIQNKFLRDIKKKYDVITLWDVLEHMPDPEQELRYISKILKKNGILVIRVPNKGYAKFKKYFFDKLGLTEKYKKGCFGAPNHLYHFSKKSLNALFEKNDFQIIKYKPARSMISDKFFLRLATSSIYYLGLLLYYLSFSKINIVIDHLVYVKKR
ncbi:methyltransferase domain-containing protein [Candidatus Woesearchaeota archaeon]|nr:methyltransferase domain-containing protein [Candidatus Woesearchaeota archaeon]